MRFTQSFGRPVLLKNSDVYVLIKERLDSGRTAELTVTGKSMQPLFKDGITRVLVAPCGDRLKRYSIALYKRADGTAVLHRYIGKSADGLCFRGDNENYTEKDIKPENVCGVAVSAVTGDKAFKLTGIKNRLYGAFCGAAYHVRHLKRAVSRRIMRKK